LHIVFGSAFVTLSFLWAISENYQIKNKKIQHHG